MMENNPRKINLNILLFFCLCCFVLTMSPKQIWAKLIKAEEIRSSLSFVSEDNLLSKKNDARVVKIHSNPETAERLIDGAPRNGWRSEEAFSKDQPVNILFRFSAQKLLASLLIQPQTQIPGSTTPKELEILTSSEENKDKFVSIGRFLLARQPGWQRLNLDNIHVLVLKLRIHSVHGSGPVGLGEVAAFAPGIDPLAPAYRFKAVAVPPVKKQPMVKKAAAHKKQGTPQVKKEQPKPKAKVPEKRTLDKAASNKPSEKKKPIKPAVKVQPQKKRTLEQKISGELKKNGYSALFFYLQDDKQVLLTGLVKTEKDLQKAVKIVRAFPRVQSVKAHLLSGSAGDIHPRKIWLQASDAMQSAGLSDVQVRMRKRGELILVGKVSNSDDKILALAIAKSQPGITKVVNQLKLQ